MRQTSTGVRVDSSLRQLFLQRGEDGRWAACGLGLVVVAMTNVPNTVGLEGIALKIAEAFSR